MDPDLIIYQLDEVWFKVGVPEVVLELRVESMLWEVEGLDDLDGLDVREG